MRGAFGSCRVPYRMPKMTDAAHTAVHTEGGAAERRAFRVSGIVQGVGYRPFVYRLAEEYALSGWVLNDSAGVGIEAEGTAAALDAFAVALADDAPRAAVVTAVTWQTVMPCGERTFRILPSPAGTRAATLVSPDLGVCADCRREILSAGDRRYGYAFTNCTNCGPRYSIIRGVPYDRPLTSMAVFPMCPACQREYDDPRDRRFHAQPNACAACGPAYRLLVNGGVQAGDPLAAARRVVAEGGILAVKGIGGYHLACDARSETAVARLRRRKHREAKALAVMAGSLAAVRALCLLSAEEEQLLTSPAAPIVLLARRTDAVRPAAESVAPGNAYLGMMLPYAPIHLLLLGADDLWVMTSANLSGAPILYRDAAAEEGLAEIADAILVHNREIVHRVDDSVVRIGAGGPQILRRSRGYAPAPLALPFADGRSVLAGGAELKNTFCLTRGGEAFLSEHIGDLTNAAALASYAETMAQYEQFFEVKPEVLAADLHPAYLSGRHLAARAAQDGLPLVRVQHHHAHIAAVLAEHGCHARVLGAALDGTGWGDDGTVWGGEFLAADLAGYERLAHFAPVPLPGGDRAAEEPWRLALWMLYRRDGAGFAAQFPQFAAQLPTGWELLMQATAAGLSAPLTSSAGRLFDAAAALLGVAYRNAYEGQAPIELERLARTARRAGRVLPYTVAEGTRLTVDVLPALYALADGAEALTVEERAGRALDFHVTMAAAVAEVLGILSVRTGLRTVALAGGVFQNALLLEELLPRIGGYHVLLPHRVPPNDGGIAYGQAAVALARMRCS